jgi:hypothetical protein
MDVKRKGYSSLRREQIVIKRLLKRRQLAEKTMRIVDE